MLRIVVGVGWCVGLGAWVIDWADRLAGVGENLALGGAFVALGLLWRSWSLLGYPVVQVLVASAYAAWWWVPAPEDLACSGGMDCIGTHPIDVIWVLPFVWPVLGVTVVVRRVAEIRRAADVRLASRGCSLRTSSLR